MRNVYERIDADEGGQRGKLDHAYSRYESLVGCVYVEMRVTPAYESRAESHIHPI